MNSPYNVINSSNTILNMNKLLLSFFLILISLSVRPSSNDAREYQLDSEVVLSKDRVVGNALSNATSYREELTISNLSNNAVSNLRLFSHLLQMVLRTLCYPYLESVLNLFLFR